MRNKLLASMTLPVEIRADGGHIDVFTPEAVYLKDSFGGYAEDILHDMGFEETATENTATSVQPRLIK